MANQSKLKAWVRTDGGGTVVGSGPIFSLKKPKVGKWREMNANLCCNSTPTPSTTTTSTTNGGGGVTPRAWLIQVFPNSQDACTRNTGYGPYIIYTSEYNLTTGVTLWSNAALTIPYSPYPGRPWIAVNTGSVTTNAYYVETLNNNARIFDEVSCLTTTTTTTPSGPYQFTVINYSSSSDACTGTNPVNTTVIYKSDPYLSAGSTLWLDAGLTQPYQTGMASWLIFTNPGYGGTAYSTTSSMGTTLITGGQNC